MAPASRRSTDSLIDRLFQEPHAFDFFQAVRILERAAMDDLATPESPDAGRIGEDKDPRLEAVRIRAQQALFFPTGEVEGAARGTRQPGGDALRRPPELTVNFMGLTGPSGVLPQHYSEFLIRATRERSIAPRDFFDIFNHRMTSLFMRAWEKYRLPVRYECGGPTGDDAITGCLLALVGLAMAGLRDRLAVDDEAVVHYAGHYAHSPRSAAALEAILSDYFERPVRVEQFRGRWVWFAPDELSALPDQEALDGRYAQLGVDAMVGERVWDVQGGFRIRIGPLTYAQFASFMPGSDAVARLVDLTRLFVGPAFSFDLQLTLAAPEVPYLTLAREGDYVPRLGWNTWLKHAEFRHDADDAVFSLDHS